MDCTRVLHSLVGDFWLPTHNQYPEFSLTASELLCPLIAYPMIWLGFHLPFQRVGARNDYSYGLYIYAFPVQQLLAIWGVLHWGFFAYFGLTMAITFPLAIVSWWAIEKHALKLKRLELPSFFGGAKREAVVVPGGQQSVAPVESVSARDPA